MTTALLLPSPFLSETAIATELCWTELDARAASPPDHFRAIIEAVKALPSGRPQFVRTHLRPDSLLQKLVTQGFCGEAVKLADGSWRPRSGELSLEFE